MKKNYLLIVTAFACLMSNAIAQSPNWLWAKRIGGTADDAGYSIAVDAFHNVYTIGAFLGTVDFDPGAGTFNLSANGSQNTFISKLDSSGNFVWAKRMGGSGGHGNTTPASMALDASGNIYTTGWFMETVDFNPGIGTFNLLSAGSWDIFISKLDASGNFKWAKRMGSTSEDRGLHISIDHAGNVYTTGTIQGTVDFDPGIGVFNLNGGIFISKLDSLGNFVWAKAINGNTSYPASSAIDVFDNIYTTGSFFGTVDFDPNAGTFNMTVNGNGSSIFIVKLDSSGNFVWAKAMSGPWNTYVQSIFLDASCKVYTTGSFSHTADFDPDSLGTLNLTSAGSDDIFISKLDSSGNFVWAKAMGGINSDGGKTIAIDASSNVYTQGFFQDVVDFDPAAGIFNLTSAGLDDIFISKLDSSGNFIWANRIGGTGNEFGYITLGTSGHAYVTGYFASPSLTFGDSTLTNAGNGDIFIAKLDTVLITGNQEIKSFDNSILFFPNPATNMLSIAFSYNNKNVIVTIADITGKMIYTTTATETKNIEISTKDFAEGMYVVQIQTEDFTKSKKLIVAK